MNNSFNHKKRCYNGILFYLTKNNIETSEKIIADLTSEFLKSKKLPYVEFSKKHKRLAVASYCNAPLVQKYFNEFTNFIKEKYKL